nr:MAG TPA: hypothetical protein [Caudoviricetes sp.]
MFLSGRRPDGRYKVVEQYSLWDVCFSPRYAAVKAANSKTLSLVRGRVEMSLVEGSHGLLVVVDDLFQLHPHTVELLLNGHVGAFDGDRDEAGEEDVEDGEDDHEVLLSSGSHYGTCENPQPLRVGGRGHFFGTKMSARAMMSGSVATSTLFSAIRSARSRKSEWAIIPITRARKWVPTMKAMVTADMMVPFVVVGLTMGRVSSEVRVRRTCSLVEGEAFGV